MLVEAPKDLAENKKYRFDLLVEAEDSKDLQLLIKKNVPPILNGFAIHSVGRLIRVSRIRINRLSSGLSKEILYAGLNRFINAVN